MDWVGQAEARVEWFWTVRKGLGKVGPILIGWVDSVRLGNLLLEKDSHCMSMVNRREANVAEKYKALGYRPMHIGAPDFLMLKIDDGQVKEVLAVEVKSKGARLSYEQSVYRDVFRRAGIEYRVEVEK